MVSMNSKLFITSLCAFILFFSFASATVTQCSGGFTNTGITLQGDWGNTVLYRCDQSFQAGNTIYSQDLYIPPTRHL